MYYVITEISSEATDDALTYLRVMFWNSQADADAGKPPMLINDFRFAALRNTTRRIVTDGRGWLKKTDGTFVNPDPELKLREALTADDFEWHDQSVDITGEIRRQIVRYWRRAQDRHETGDRTTTRIVRDTRDPHNILRRQDVALMVNSGLTVEAD